MMGPIIFNLSDIVPPFIEGGKILDFGCGNDDTIAWMKDFGWQTYGVNISSTACEVARGQGLDVFCGDIRNACYSPQFFDLITMNHVLEHLYDPVGILKECSRILKADGLLIVDVPNFRYIDADKFGASWSHLEVPRHLFHFTYDTLSILLRRAGFCIEKFKFKPAFPPFFRDRGNVKFFIENNGGISYLSLMRLYAREYLGKPIAYLISKDRNRKFSNNIAAYATRFHE